MGDEEDIFTHLLARLKIRGSADTIRRPRGQALQFEGRPGVRALQEVDESI